DAQSLIESGNTEEGLARLEQEMKAHPHDNEIRTYYLRNRAVAVQRYVNLGDQARSNGALDRAEEAYKRAQRFDAETPQAAAGLAGVATDRRALATLGEAQAAQKRGDDAAAYAKAKEVLAENPQQRDARAIVRKTEEKAAKAESATPQLSEA